MGFCSKCGYHFEDGAEFCPKCGSKVEGNVVHGGSFVDGDAMMDRMHTINEYTKIRDYFLVKADRYEELAEAEFVLANSNIKYSKGRVIWGAILLGLGVIGLIAAIAEPRIGAFIICAVLFAFGGIMFSSYFKKTNAVKRMVEENTKIRDEATKELMQYYMAYGICPIGFEFTYPDKIEAIGNVLKEGSAYTFKEAIQIVKEDEHRKNLEKIELIRAAATQNVADEIRRL